MSRFQIPASPLSSDAEFLRRVCLDLTGTLPPPDRAREFIASRDPRKRTKLIDALLDSPEYVDYWTFRFGRLFRVAAGAVGGAEHAYTYWRWVWENIAQNKSYRDIALERLAAQGYGGASRHFLSYGEEAKAADIMPEEVRVFLGRRLDCAQCHDHPYEQWSQDQFWGLASFFGQISRTEWTGFGAAVLFDDPAGRQPDFGESAETVKVIHPRRKQLVEPAFLDGRAIAAEGASHPRREFARWVTSHPYFAETLVNRLWGHLFGRGLVDPVDDFRSTNPPTHPGLLKALAEDCRLHGYDLKQILRRITRSRTYQLASTPLQSNGQDTLNYSHFIPKPLEAEVLLDAISQVTGVPEIFENGQGARLPWEPGPYNWRCPTSIPPIFCRCTGDPISSRSRKSRPRPASTRRSTCWWKDLHGEDFQEGRAPGPVDPEGRLPPRGDSGTLPGRLVSPSLAAGTGRAGIGPGKELRQEAGLGRPDLEPDHLTGVRLQPLTPLPQNPMRAPGDGQ